MLFFSHVCKRNNTSPRVSTARKPMLDVPANADTQSGRLVHSLKSSAPRRQRPGWAEIGQFLAFAIVYVVTAKLGFRAAFVADQVSPVWPPTGLALWAGLYFGARVW